MTGDEPAPRDVVAAYRRGLVLVFGQPRKLVSIGVLLLVLLVPVLGRVSTGSISWVTTFVVISLACVTYVRRDGATVGVSLLWLGGVAVLCSLLAAPWLGVLLVLMLVPYVAICAAAWASGSWRTGGRAVLRMVRETWWTTLGMSLVVNCLFVAVLGAALAIGVGGVPVGIGLLLVVAFVGVETALAIGYALVALERAELSQP